MLDNAPINSVYAVRKCVGRYDIPLSDLWKIMRSSSGLTIPSKNEDHYVLDTQKQQM